MKRICSESLRIYYIDSASFVETAIGQDYG